nr:MAG TPA: hypothetical protein [Caudoviricetes sp.]DAI04362.1 MAG TPA: hypothetical protein [Caudoviricetes sp.]
MVITGNLWKIIYKLNIKIYPAFRFWSVLSC